MALCGLPALLAAAGAGQAARPDGAQEALPPKTGGVYRRPLDNDPRTLDAAFVSNIYSFSVIQQLFEGLVQYDATAGTRPGLAQSWKASWDGLTWTFARRQGVKFHYGRLTTGGGILPPEGYGYDPAFHEPAYDLVRAKALLAEAGYPGGARLPNLEFWSNRKSEEALAEHAAITQNLVAIGVQVSALGDHYIPMQYVWLDGAGTSGRLAASRP